MLTTVILVAAILALAVLYSSVGHAGASGYLAAMALVGLAPDVMKPTALVLNVFVASIGTFQFVRAGHFHFATLLPFVLAAIPLAFIGGNWQLPASIYKPLVGAVLLFAAVNLIRRALKKSKAGAGTTRSPSMPPLWIGLVVGGAIGLLAGLTGTGGGIFLSPLLILCGWASPTRTAAVSVVFVLLNSISGLAGFVVSHPDAMTAEQLFGLGVLPSEIPYYIAAAVVGGVIGSTLGSKKLGGEGIRLLLGVVLLIAAAKMFLTAWS